MGNLQNNQGERKSNKVPFARLFGPLMIGIFLCALSFFADRAVIEWVKMHDWKSLKEVAGFLSRWGDWPELMLFASIGLCPAWLGRSRVVCKTLLCMMIAATISGAAVNSVRLLSGRARPNNTQATQEWNGLWSSRGFLLFQNKYHSFPSGHTGAAFAFFGVPWFAERRYGWWALIAAIAIGWSRLYLNVHYLSDVMVGMLVGLVTAFFVWARLQSRIDRFLGDLRYF
ncbi:MAG: phosphatase PAP2 family protein [Verrucomicrobia bacterium]|nr:phosphatase PAP2 family protein [Verrucomicrobiota bacterium]